MAGATAAWRPSMIHGTFRSEIVGAPHDLHPPPRYAGIPDERPGHMRIRQVKPDYWRDELIASLPDSVSRFYIGLWQEADDAGWLRWNVPEIGHDLYGYQPRQRRERWVKERGEALAAVGRLHFYDCGHAFLPNLVKHQRLGGKPYIGVQIAHDRDCARSIADDRPGKVGKGKVMERVGSADAREGDKSPPTDHLATVIGPERLDRIRRKAAGE